MALRHMGQFVAEDASHCVLAGKVHQKAGEDIDIAGRHGKGIHGIVEDDACLEGIWLGRYGLHYAADQVFHIGGNFRVLDHGDARSYGYVELAPHLLFVPERYAAKVESLCRKRKGKAYAQCEHKPCSRYPLQQAAGFLPYFFPVQHKSVCSG